MPRVSWRGFLRFSLVSCPIFLSAAVTRAKRIRLRQVWRPPVEEAEDDLPERGEPEDGIEPPRPKFLQHDAGDDPRERDAATRVTIRPHDPGTGAEIDKSEVVKGYEYSRSQFVTFTPEELKALDVESSKVIELEKFVSRGELDPVYFDSPYYLYPDGPVAVETLRVIGAAMAELGVAGLGRLTLSRRERMVMVEPRGTGMALFTLRAAEEVRAPQFGIAEGELDAEMVSVAKAIIAQRTGRFDPATFRDRYQEALRELIEAKMKGRTIKPQPVSAPAPVIDLMAALKRSLAQGSRAGGGGASTQKRTKAPDRRQPPLLLPVSGARRGKPDTISSQSTTAARRRKNA